MIATRVLPARRVPTTAEDTHLFARFFASSVVRHNMLSHEGMQWRAALEELGWALAYPKSERPDFWREYVAPVSEATP